MAVVVVLAGGSYLAPAVCAACKTKEEEDEEELVVVGDEEDGTCFTTTIVEMKKACLAGESNASLACKVVVQLPKVKAGAKWVKDAFHTDQAGVDQSATGAEGAGRCDPRCCLKGCCKSFAWRNYSVDMKTFEVIRDWTQIMSLIFSSILPSSPSFTAVFGKIFNVCALDVSALFTAMAADKALQDSIVIVWSNIVYISCVVLVFAFASLVVVESNPDAIDDGAEMQSYNDYKRVTTLKLATLRACHFMYLPVCRTVFNTWYDTLYMGVVPSTFTWFASFFIFMFFVLPVPGVTYKLIEQNKPRGSTEDPDYTFDLEGNKVKMTEDVYLTKVKALMDKESTSYNPWAGLFGKCEGA